MSRSCCFWTLKTEKNPGIAGKIPAVLTGKDGGEEDVVGERNEPTLSERVENAVLVGKLLPLLGQLLLIQPSQREERKHQIKQRNGRLGLLYPYHQRATPWTHTPLLSPSIFSGAFPAFGSVQKGSAKIGASPSQMRDEELHWIRLLVQLRWNTPK